MARPSKCTPEVIAKICEALKLGVSWAATWRVDWRVLLGHVQRVRRRTVRPSEVEAIGTRLVGVDWLGVG